MQWQGRRETVVYSSKSRSWRIENLQCFSGILMSYFVNIWCLLKIGTDYLKIFPFFSHLVGNIQCPHVMSSFLLILSFTGKFKKKQCEETFVCFELTTLSSAKLFIYSFMLVGCVGKRLGPRIFGRRFESKVNLLCEILFKNSNSIHNNALAPPHKPLFSSTQTRVHTSNPALTCSLTKKWKKKKN